MNIPEKTHPGNLNRTEVSSTGRQGTSGNKTNNDTATLRKDNLPKPIGVTTVNRDANKGAAMRASAKQNNGNVLPATQAHEDRIRDLRK